MMRCMRAGRGNGARIANADALRPMSAFGRKADIAFCGANVRFWPKADIRTVTANVAFGGKRGIHRT